MSISTSSIKFTGMASGIDTEKIVTDLMKVEKLPLTKLQQQRQTLMWKREQYQETNLQYSSLRNLADGLRFESSFDAKVATSNNSTIVTAQSTTGAVEGSYSIKVNELASTAVVAGESLAAGTTLTQTGLTEGKFTITGPGGPKEITVTSTSTRQSVINDINNAGIGITASYDATNMRLMLSTKQTGAAASITIDDTANVLKSNLGIGTTALTSGKDANVEINGAAMKMATNTFNFNGVTFSLKGTSSAAVSVDVAQDTEKIVSKITDFVNKYNELIDSIKSKLDEKHNREYAPLTEEQREAMTESQITIWESKAKKGLLANDDMLESTLSTLRNSFMNQVKGLPIGKNTLSSIGIATASGKDAYKENGKLHIDTVKLKEALAADPESVKALFSKASTSDPKLKSEMGFAERIKQDLDQSISNMARKIGSSSQSETVDSSLMGTELKYLNTKIYSTEDKVTAAETRYYKQFAAMEKAIQNLNNKGSWLTSQLSSS
ncbi:flagellar filament capping protein FliD [Paenibacillus sp. sgz5001063]|uniref:flagellar filament capping protein FliD n=1 Tax=Paenibacillus sp. sgz5001063 TaxID=3242474 RepID=UPI0036D3C471